MTRYYNGSIRNLVYRLRKFRSILEESLEQEIRYFAPEIIRMITEEQLFEQGITGKGVEIKSYQPYSPRTIYMKRRKGQPTTRVTLRDTGEFHASFDVKFDEGGFYIEARDPKTKYLVKRYGQEIFRLTDANLSKLLRDLIRPSLLKRLKEKL